MTLSPLWATLSDIERMLLNNLRAFTAPFTLDEAYQHVRNLKLASFEFYQLFYSLEFDGFLAAENYEEVSMEQTKYYLTSSGKIACSQQGMA